ncbi:MAG: hypothetical protein ABIR70_17030 [Bryobacteraceae bacterium]
MPRLRERSSGTFGSPDSRIAFTPAGRGDYETWDRYLLVDGKRAYNLGNACQTCGFFFKRLEGANTSINVEHTANVLRTGIHSLSDTVVAEIGKGLPSDNYLSCLFETSVQLVRPGDPEDYFVKEQVEQWGVDGFWDLPHDPRVAYYRIGEGNPRPDTKCFHFLIPMFPERWLEESVLSEYEDELERGGTPTAVAISILDVVGPAVKYTENPYTEHWNYAHFLIDGHHKVAAARRAGKPIRLLSFLSLTQGISTPEQVHQGLT